ncbi:hypothetical protein [Larkinella sp. C7]|jgi:hypothetical protein|uniref:hypothetical protein n=1 Tax=Larkinella sp. C7 TaxID=2576607 RepID=UPI001E32677F|nr:hypothetical protein [Larkinella sp. C7]
MLPIQLTQDEFERIAGDVVAGIVQEALQVMQRRVQDAGFVLMGDLLRSQHLQTAVLAKDLYAEFSIGFAGYGRFKDMRKLNAAHRGDGRLCSTDWGGEFSVRSRLPQ